MKINWLEIKDFRSIKDSGRIYVDSNITVLAGKNESGKTNVLKALDCFSRDKFSEDDKPQDFHEVEDEVLNPTITISFDIPAGALNDISEIGEKYSKLESLEFIVERSMKVQDILSGNALEAIQESIIKQFEEKNKVLIDKFRLIENNIEDLTLPAISMHTPDDIQSYASEIKGIFDEESLEIDEDSEEYNSVLEIRNIVKKITEIAGNFAERESELLNILPKFVMFDSFTDILPNNIHKEDAPKKIVKDFFKLTTIESAELLFGKTGQERKRMADKVSTTITVQFESFYSQNEIKLKISVDGDELYFYIYDKEEQSPFRPDQRSKGFQWFLSFFITLHAQGDESLIILIDEPGLYLHAKAQEDVLRILEGLSEKNQIILTTHSPYLLDPTRLERIKLVYRDEDEFARTKIENKIHRKADQETLTPIITAIGHDLSRSLTFSNELNILVEGISDYYYLHGMYNYLNDSSMILANIIPCVGATKIPNLTSLLIGWGLEFKVVIDHDSEGIRVKKDLEKLTIDESKILFVTQEKGKEIEDLFTKSDFRSIVLMEDEDKYSKDNSVVVKGYDKVLLAKKFKENIDKNKGKIKLDKETVENFSELFERIFRESSQGVFT